MTLDEAIRHCEEVSSNCEEQAKQCDSDDRYERHVMHENAKCAADHRQLAEWLTELKELREENITLKNYNERLKDSVNSLVLAGELDYAELAEAKRLLKLAVEDINFYVDCYEAHCDECCCSQDNHCHWKYEAAALKLIGEDADTND